MTQTLSPICALNGDRASAFCFGTMQFGGKANLADSEATFGHCRAAGINFFDTAYGYTGGLSEKYLGSFAKPEREALIIASKCGYTGGSGADNIRTQFDESRSRLGMDLVDILYLHRWDPETPLEESFTTLAELIQAGSIRYIGVSNFAAWQVVKASQIAQKLGVDIHLMQPMYNLVKRQAEVEILPMCQSEGLFVAPYSPLGGGLLTGKYGQASTSGRLTEDKRYHARYGQGWMAQSAQGLADIARETGHDPATLAVAWVARNPTVSAPIISGCNIRQLAPSLAALDLTLDDALYQRISALSPAPPPATDRLEETKGL